MLRGAEAKEKEKSITIDKKEESHSPTATCICSEDASRSHSRSSRSSESSFELVEKGSRASVIEFESWNDDDHHDSIHQQIGRFRSPQAAHAPDPVDASTCTLCTPPDLEIKADDNSDDRDAGQSYKTQELFEEVPCIVLIIFLM